MKIKLFTIGFTEKSAEYFFKLLKEAGVKKIIDTRLNNVSQLAGFAKGKDLAYFAREIANIDYEHRLEFAPSKEILTAYRDKKITWEEYENEYIKLLNNRNILTDSNINSLANVCLLCSEHLPDYCHRRLLAQYLQKKFCNIEIIHLM